MFLLDLYSDWRSGARKCVELYDQPNATARMKMDANTYPTHNTLLFFIINTCPERVAEYLEEFPGTNVNHANSAGWTPLMYAIQKRHKQVVQILLAAGANPNAVNADGVRPLFLAVWRRTSVKALINAGADLTATFNGNTVLMDACIKYQPATVAELIAAGIDVSLENDNGDTALHLAVTHNKGSKIVKKLMAVMRNVNDINSEGETALMIACQLGKVKIVRALLVRPNKSLGVRLGPQPEAHLADPNIADDNGLTALKLATQLEGCTDIFAKNDYKIIKMLFQAGAEPDQDSFNNVLWHNGGPYYEKLVCAFIRRGADLGDIARYAQVLSNPGQVIAVLVKVIEKLRGS